MATNKVVYGNTTLIDLTNDTATEADVVSGKTFHKKNGVAAIGTASLAKPEQTKTVTATTSQQTVTPDSGKVLSSVTVNPQIHTETYIPAANTASNDMGANHNKRYVNTSGMIVPSGTQSITANGTYDISSKASVNVSVDLTETLLWGNNNSSQNFEGQNITLRESANNFKYLKVAYNISTNNTLGYNAIVPVSNLSVMKNSLDYFYSGPGCLWYHSGTKKWQWRSLYVDASLDSGSYKIFRFTDCIQCWKNGWKAANTVCIPVAIYGLK